MKLVATSSQTVGPFFSIGLAPLCQDAEAVLARLPDAITLRGVVLDGNYSPIPDCVLEFFAADFFARVATSTAGKYRVTIPSAASTCEVLVFMRGLLKPTLTRIYFQEVTMRGDPALKNVPGDRVATLVARTVRGHNQREWNVVMQGENETVFFEL